MATTGLTYRIPNLPDISLRDIPTPERLLATAPQGGIGSGPSIARALGLTPNVPVSDEAWRAMNQSEVGAVQSEAGRAGNWNILKILAAVASMFAPEVMTIAGGANMESEKSEGRAFGTVRRAERRARVNRQQSLAERLADFQSMQEGLVPTAADAVPGYMSVGEARGRSTIAMEDKSKAALEKVAQQHMAKFKDTAEAILKQLATTGKITRGQQSALKLYGELMQSQNPFAALLNTTTQNRMADIFKQMELEGTVAGPGGAKEAKLPKALEGATGEKGQDRYTDSDGSIWDWDYSAKQWLLNKR